MIDILMSLAEELHIESTKIQSWIINNEKYSSHVFDDPIRFNAKAERPKSIRGRRGIYIFVSKKRIPMNRRIVTAWNDVGGAGFNEDYLKNITSIKEGDCFYLGSCASEDSGSLYVRIGQHLGNYSGLKLANPTRVFMKDSLDVIAFPIRKEYKGYYRIILTTIEKQLHLIIKPKTGASRV